MPTHFHTLVDSEIDTLNEDPIENNFNEVFYRIVKREALPETLVTMFTIS